MPTVLFPQTAPVYTSHRTVAFPIVIDERAVTAEISAEALQVRFGATSNRGPDLIEAFQWNRAAIEAIGRVKLPPRIAAGRGLLVTADFSHRENFTTPAF